MSEPLYVTAPFTGATAGTHIFTTPLSVQITLIHLQARVLGTMTTIASNFVGGPTITVSSTGNTAGAANTVTICSGGGAAGPSMVRRQGRHYLRDMDRHFEVRGRTSEPEFEKDRVSLG